MCDYLPCDTAGLEQLRERAIREEELLGASDESSRCLLFIFVMVPQFKVFVDALLSIIKRGDNKTLISLLYQSMTKRYQ